MLLFFGVVVVFSNRNESFNLELSGNDLNTDLFFLVLIRVVYIAITFDSLVLVTSLAKQNTTAEEWN